MVRFTQQLCWCFCSGGLKPLFCLTAFILYTCYYGNVPLTRSVRKNLKLHFSVDSIANDAVFFSYWSCQRNITIIYFEQFGWIYLLIFTCYFSHRCTGSRLSLGCVKRRVVWKLMELAFYHQLGKYRYCLLLPLLHHLHVFIVYIRMTLMVHSSADHSPVCWFYKWIWLIPNWIPAIDQNQRQIVLFLWNVIWLFALVGEFLCLKLVCSTFGIMQSTIYISGFFSSSHL